MLNASPEFWEEANGEGIAYPAFGLAFLLFRFCLKNTAITRKLSTTSPTTTPIAAAPPEFNPPGSVDELFANTVVPLVGFAVGFSDIIDGEGEEGLPLVEELLGGEIAGGEEVEGTEGGGAGNVGLGGEFVAGGGAD